MFALSSKNGHTSIQFGQRYCTVIIYTDALNVFTLVVNANLDLLYYIQPMVSPGDKSDSSSKVSCNTENELSSSPDERGITRLSEIQRYIYTGK